MLELESGERSFFDAGLAVEGLLELRSSPILQARYVGQAKVRYQALAAALVTNLVQLPNVMTQDPSPSLAWKPA